MTDRQMDDKHDNGRPQNQHSHFFIYEQLISHWLIANTAICVHNVVADNNSIVNGNKTVMRNLE